MRNKATERLLTLVFVLLLVALSPLHKAHAATTPIADQLGQSGAPIYDGLGQANHVFGFRFTIRESGQIDQLGGYFSGVKEVVIVNASDDIVATATVAGNSSDFSWSTLEVPLLVEPGQTFRILVRAGSNQSSSAVWSMAMPFTRDAIEVISLEQGWSSSTDPQQWVMTTQSLPEQHARGLVDFRFIPAGETIDSAGEPEDSGEPEDNPGSEQTPVAGDPYPDTVGVIDSFGQSEAAGSLGMGFMVISAYYRDFPRQAGECSEEVHNRYWVKDAHGVTHPTWHPPVDPVTGCRFAHEHGDDPGLSPNL